MAYYVRSMRKDDIPQVALIDREAFPTMLPPPNFERELKNQMTHFYVVCDDTRQVDYSNLIVSPASKSGLMTKLKKWLNPDDIEEDTQVIPGSGEYVCGYVGFWVMSDEAHITTIAVREDLQRQGLGELLVMTVFDRARELYATILTLEVRVSNTGAQELYKKYGFRQVGVRRGYYTDNREDAYVMTTGDITSTDYREQLDELFRVHSSKWGKPQFQFVTDMS